MLADRRQAQPFDIVDGRGEADGADDVGRAGLEAGRGIGVSPCARR